MLFVLISSLLASPCDTPIFSRLKAKNTQKPTPTSSSKETKVELPQRFSLFIPFSNSHNFEIDLQEDGEQQKNSYSIIINNTQISIKRWLDGNPITIFNPQRLSRHTNYQLFISRNKQHTIHFVYV